MMRLHEYRCGRYEIEADLHKAFVIRSIRLNGHNLLDARQGLYFTVTAGGREESSPFPVRPTRRFTGTATV